MDIVEKPSQLKVAREFFREYTTPANVSRIIYPDGKFKRTTGTVTRCVKEWTKKGYLEEGFTKVEVKQVKNPFLRKVPAMRLKINPYFEYISDKLKTPVIKNIELMKMRIELEGEIIRNTKNELITARKNLKEYQKFLKEKYDILDTSLKSLDKLPTKVSNKTFTLINKRWEIEKFVNSHKNSIKNLKEYINYETSLVKFNLMEKEIIKLIFENNIAREIVCDYDNIFEGITIFLENIFLHKRFLYPGEFSFGEFFIKEFLSKRQSYSKKININKLRSKIMKISNFRAVKYLKMEAKEKFKRSSAQ